MEKKRRFWTKRNRVIAVIISLSALLTISMVATVLVYFQMYHTILDLRLRTFRCPENYALNTASRMCVRLVSEGKTWSEAKQYCESQGDTLAQFKTSASVKWLRDYIIRHAPRESRKNCNWIGLSYKSGYGWSWIDGTPLDSYLWDRSAGQPDNSDGTSCGCECNFNSLVLGLHDCRCSQSGVYSLCERPVCQP